MLRVGINGFGTIGKRVADAVRAQPDMRVAGVAKRSPNYEAAVAVDRGYSLYAAGEEGDDAFEAAGVPVEGDVEALVATSDVVVDATPSGVGERNRPLYERHDTPAVFQGGEDADVAPTSFVARASYDEARGADAVRVVSCNTTGLARLLAPLDDAYGVERAQATLVRRGGDPSQSGRGPINDTLPDPIEIPSHHGPDLQTVLPDVAITTMGLKVPATLMHTHALTVTVAGTPDAAAVRDCLATESRVLVLPSHLGIDGAGKLADYTGDAGRPRGDLWENCVWADSLACERRPDGRTDVHCFQAIHQEADVVPENVDAIRALVGVDREESVRRTDEALGVGSGLVAREGGGPTAVHDATSDD